MKNDKQLTPEEVAKELVPGDGFWVESARERLVAAIYLVDDQHPSAPSTEASHPEGAK